MTQSCFRIQLRANLPCCTAGTGNAGIGLETVRHLAASGMTVIIGCRDVRKGEEAVHLLQQDHTGN